MFELVVEGWSSLAEMLRVGPGSLAVFMGVGGAIYTAAWGCWRWIQFRRADPFAGSSLLGFLGIRSPENRLMRGTVTRVIDGNTIEIGGTRTVRLIGIDAPENTRCDKLRRDASQTGIRPSEVISQGRRARQWLAQEIEGTRVELELDPCVDDRDCHGHWLAHVWTVDRRNERGLHLGEMIVWEGFAVPRGGRHAHQKRIDKARAHASKAGRGEDLGVPAGSLLPPDSSGQSEEEPVTTGDLGIFSSLKGLGGSAPSGSGSDKRQEETPLNEEVQNSRYWRPGE